MRRRSGCTPEAMAPDRSVRFHDPGFLFGELCGRPGRCVIDAALEVLRRDAGDLAVDESDEQGGFREPDRALGEFQFHAVGAVDVFRKVALREFDTVGRWNFHGDHSSREPLSEVTVEEIVARAAVRAIERDEGRLIKHQGAELWKVLEDIRLFDGESVPTLPHRCGEIIDDEATIRTAAGLELREIDGHVDVGGDRGAEGERDDHAEARHERMTKPLWIGLGPEKDHEDSAPDQDLHAWSDEPRGAFPQ